MTTRRSLLPMTAALLFTSFISTAAYASCVNPGGTAGCFSTIQDAVNAAKRGEVISIAAGTYVENVTIGPGKGLTRTGAGSASTILDGNATDTVISIVGPKTRVAISGVTIQNASGPGISVSRIAFSSGKATLTLINSTVSHNINSATGAPSFGFGGGMFIDAVNSAKYSRLHNCQQLFRGGGWRRNIRCGFYYTYGDGKHYLRQLSGGRGWRDYW
jgi:hypothetical protein